MNIRYIWHLSHSSSWCHCNTSISLFQISFLGPYEDKDGWLAVFDWSLRSASGQCGQSRSWCPGPCSQDTSLGLTRARGTGSTIRSFTCSLRLIYAEKFLTTLLNRRFVHCPHKCSRYVDSMWVFKGILISHPFIILLLINPIASHLIYLNYLDCEEETS